ncbi:MAG: S66 peptidase family protein [Putridiphycobacter sp.]
MSKIRIVAPAKFIEKEKVVYAKKFLEKNGFIVEISENCLGQFNYFSGSDAQRLNDFQDALDDPTVDIILCARGGYGSVRIIDKLNFDKFIECPKPIVGFSDITVFHNHIHQNFNLPTVHATVPLNFESNTHESLESLLAVLQKQPLKYNIQPNNHNVLGRTEAIIVGGNLSILYSLVGTNSDINLDGKILFIEDLAENLYVIDRMFWALKKSGKLNKLKGLIVGGFTNIKDTEVPFGKTLNEIVLEHFETLNIPICFDFPAGHIDDNRAIIFGKPAKLIVENHQVSFEQGKF